jgi:hypothetical protein
VVARLAGFWLVDGGINEPRWLFNLAIRRGLGVQVPAFPENWHPAHQERRAAQIGGSHTPIVWVLEAKDKRNGTLIVQRYD